MEGALRSKILGWLLLGVVVVLIIATFDIHTPIWGYADEFCAFMMVFSHLMAIYLGKMSKAASRKLDVIALVFGGLMIIALICEYFIFTY